MLIIGTTSPTNPPETLSTNDYEQQQQQHDNLISKILSPSSSSSQNKKNPNPTPSSSSSSSSWLRTEHYKLTTAKQEDLQYVENTDPRNEELREKGISQNLSIVSFDFCPCLASVCVNEREKKEKKKEKIELGGKLIYWLFFWPIYLLCFSIISMERNFQEEWWKKKIFGVWEIRLWRVVGMRSWGIFGKEGKSER